MNSLLNSASVFLSIEFLKSNPFQDILFQNSKYLQYIDYAQLLDPRRTKLPNIIAKFNNIEPTIEFTFEDETNNTLNFLDIHLIRDNYDLKFKVYR